MRKFPLLVALTFASAGPCLAQTSAAYKTDNFDIPNAVQVAKPPAPPASPSRTARSLTKSQNYKYIPTTQPLILHTSMSISTSLLGFTTGDSAVDNFIVESGLRNSVDPLLIY